MNYKCDGKRKLTYTQAAAHLKHHHYSDDSARLTMYRCEDCGWWHIGNSRKRRKIR